jgi:hypothetical protein
VVELGRVEGSNGVGVGVNVDDDDDDDDVVVVVNVVDDVVDVVDVVDTGMIGAGGASTTGGGVGARMTGAGVGSGSNMGRTGSSNATISVSSVVAFNVTIGTDTSVVIVVMMVALRGVSMEEVAGSNVVSVVFPGVVINVEFKSGVISGVASGVGSAAVMRSDSPARAVMASGGS